MINSILTPPPLQRQTNRYRGLVPTPPPPPQLGTPFWGEGGGGVHITSQRLLDQSQARPVYVGKRHTPPFWVFLGLFAYPSPRG